MQISVRALGIVLCYPVQGLKTGLSAVKDNLHGKSGVAELQEVRDAKLPTIKANRAVMHCSMGEWAFFFFFFSMDTMHTLCKSRKNRKSREIFVSDRQEKPLCSSSTEALVWTGLDGGAEPGSCQCPYPTAQPSAEGGTGGLGAGVPLPCQPQHICTELEHHFC